MGFLLNHLLTESAARFPEKIAIWAQGRCLTYQELEEKSNQLAHLLHASGVRKGDRVGLYLRKSVESVVVMIGALKAGAIYVPLDPQAPTERITRIIEDCQIKAMVSTSDKIRAVKSAGAKSIRFSVLVDRTKDDTLDTDTTTWDRLADFPAGGAPQVEQVSTDVAYILYTSGSTGRPKGVMISHLNALTFVEWCAETFRIQAGDRLSNHAPLHFDLSVFDIYNGIKAGATVFMISEDVVMFPASFASFLETNGITVLYCVPSALVHLLLHGKTPNRNFRDLRLILFAGEVFPMKYLRDLVKALPGREFFNLYGPTETNVCTYCKVEPDLLANGDALPIGRACSGTAVFVVDDKGELASVPGQTGELYVRGPSVTYGYWGDPKKTSSVVVRNTFQTHFEEKAYRTGDIVRVREDGGFDFLGRRDSMVKSRGYRIELGEIEAGLQSHPKVREAVAMAVPDEEVGARIKAVVAPLEGTVVTTAELQQHCATLMPKYMVPEVIEMRESLPRTSTGKLDRMGLAAGVVTSGR